MFICAEITTQDVAWRQIFSVLTVLKRIQINSLAQRKITSRLMTASLNKSELIWLLANLPMLQRSSSFFYPKSTIRLCAHECSVFECCYRKDQ
mmetsp:Transcript_30037/g.43860  ORF Transcript_30037/g.43860 Transcript_30037/m.43860 type:complete len:93 (-) Transcript_30037:1592-1870(-)